MSVKGSRVEPLRDNPEVLKTVVSWVDEEWGAFSKRTYDQTLERFRQESAHTVTRLPLTLVALTGDVPIGMASIRERDSVDYDTNNGPWICDVYTPKCHRGKGVAKILCKELESVAKDLGYATLFLASPLGADSLYYSIGYEVYATYELANIDLYLMRKNI